MGIFSNAIKRIIGAVDDAKKERDDLNSNYAELKERVKQKEAEAKRLQEEEEKRKKELDGAAQRADDSLKKILGK